MSELPDYYQVLNIPVTASQKDIRDAYRRESLRTHPDRVEPSKRKTATAKFQLVADAYYVLQDSERRASYDAQRRERPHAFNTNTAQSSYDYFSNFFQQAPGAFPDDDPEEEELRDDFPRRNRNQPDADATFGDVFEDLLRPEVHRVMPLWTWIGGVAGATLGFIAGNLPGAAIGAYGGSRLGAVRDAKGKAVYEVFKDLNAGQRAEILRGLATKVLGSIVS